MFIAYYVCINYKQGYNLKVIIEICIMNLQLIFFLYIVVLFFIYRLIASGMIDFPFLGEIEN